MLFLSLFGKPGDVLGEDVIEGFEILGSDGISREGDRKGERGFRSGGHEGVEVRVSSGRSSHSARRVHRDFYLPSQFDNQIDITIRER